MQKLHIEFFKYDVAFSFLIEAMGSLGIFKLNFESYCNFNNIYIYIYIEDIS